MPSDLDLAVRSSKRFEAILGTRFGARGRGLHEKVDSVKRDLDAETVRALRLIATVRNKIVHEDGYNRIDDKRRFKDACRHADRALRRKSPMKQVVFLIFVVMLLALAAAAVVSGRIPLGAP